MAPLSINDDKRVSSLEEIISPLDLINKLPASKEVENFVNESRTIISNIINLKDSRVLVITWPCSIHDSKSALEIANKLVYLKERFPNIYPIMRVYFEKPRTTVWWKWLINDPYLDNSCYIHKWLELAREILLKINEIWVPTAVEFLDTLNPQYFADLVHWWAIWARTTESQEHRKMVSWLSMPVWFKNWTDWSIQIAIDAIESAKSSHSFLWITKDWRVAKITTTWNNDWHIILRWWNKWTNYDEENVNEVINKLDEKWIETWIIIDFSHANSRKDYKNQEIVCKDVAKQIREWNKKIVWVMIESHLKEWKQDYTPWKDNPFKIEYWKSITDACVWWEKNLEMLKLLDLSSNSRSKK